MRSLTLNEKITVKGRLVAEKNVPGSLLVRLDMKAALEAWWHYYGKPLSYFAHNKMFRKQNA
jgi:hypothetical protein